MSLSRAYLALIAFICIVLSDILTRINSFIGESNGSTLAIAIASSFSLVVFIYLHKSVGLRNKLPKYALYSFLLLMSWSIVCLLRGLMSSQSYWDYKYLLLAFFLGSTVPLSLVLGVNYLLLKNTLNFILKGLFLFSFLIIPYALEFDQQLYARLVVCVSLFILFIPYLTKRWILLILLVTIVSIFFEFTYRTNLIRIGSSLIILFLFYFRNFFLNKNFLNSLLILMVSTPVILLILGITGHFNVFSDSFSFDFQKYVILGGAESVREITADTRTFLYDEVLHSMTNHDVSFIFGMGGLSGYDSVFFNEDVGSFDRYATEIGLLNILMTSGILGIFLYVNMFILAAYFAINRSNNYLCKMLALYIIIYWITLFVENIPLFNMGNYFIWVTIGLCLSEKFRGLTDNEVKGLLRFFLNKKH